MGKKLRKIPGVKNVAKIISKVVPNELKPILPYVAAFYGGPALSSMFAGSATGLGALIANNPTLTKALISGTTRGLIDDDASLKEIATSGILAAAPDLLSKGLGNLASSGTIPGIGPTQTPMSGFDKAIQGAKNIAGQAGSAIEGAGALKTIGAQASGDVSMSAIEAAKLAQEEYERQNQDFQNFAGQQLADFSAGRRAAILGSMGRAGFAEDEINATLAQLGLRNGGRVGYEMGGNVSPFLQMRRGELPVSSEREFIQSLIGLGTSPPTEPPFLKFRRGELPVSSEREFIQALGLKSNSSAPIFNTGTTSTPFQSNNIEKTERIRSSLNRAGFAEDEINATLAQLGLRNGGRVGYEMGGDVSPTDSDEEGMGGVIYYDEEGRPISQKEAMEYFNRQAEEEYRQKNNKAMGGIINLMEGGMPSMEMDYRGGGFIPVGAKEKADDVPARLSKNEFVMTADAVRAAGGGSVNEGARRMYELMNNLEARA